MTTKEEEFLRQLRATFRVEAAEHLQAITTALLKLEQTSAADAQRGLIQDAFRAAHSLKGAARAVDFTEIESHCQSLEDLFAMLKREKKAPSPETLDALHRTLNVITAAVSPPAASAATVATVAADERFRSTEPAAAEAGDKRRSDAVEEQRSSPEDTVRISVAKLDRRLTAAEEMLVAKLFTGQRAEELRALAQRFDEWRNEWADVETDARVLRQASDRVEASRDGHALNPHVAHVLHFLEWNVSYVRSLESRLATLTRTAEQDHHVVGRLVDELLEDSKSLLLLPFATLAVQFPKVVRDLCREQGKEADLVMRGEDVEIDKRILEEMKDPIIHLLRNSVDHGIETQETRARLGKPARATITLTVSHVNGDKVEIVVGDDGAGIDAGRVKQSAIKLGVLAKSDARDLSDVAARDLVFHADVSTSPIITRLSGRGLGLAIVRERVEKLGGMVSIESHPGAGTRFHMVIPTRLATFRGILVEASGRLFVVPSAHVERVARVKMDEVQTVEGRETIALNGRAVARVRMADVLELPSTEDQDASAVGPVVVLGVGDHRIAFAVDAVLDEHEVLAKRLGRPLVRVRNIAGATVLGSGKVVPILNVPDLLKSARKGGGRVARASFPDAAKPAETKTILVAEDSITSRTLLKSILEAAGYQVKTAIDGMEAFALLRAERFDLVISDVEMPRLNGFDLTARIRADRKLADLPVVLVTALESREDRERGIEVGANAYIIKSSFDQSNLLETVRRML